MNPTDFQYLITDDARELIERHIGDRAEVLALKLRNPLVTQQIKLLQKSRQKLPSYFEARCLLTPTAYEQSSSEATARARTRHLQPGKLAVDLTAGLGVDSWGLSRKFDRLIDIEADPVRAEMARWNFGKLGVSNVEVLHDTAETFIAQYEGPRIDLVYVDPSRKTTDGKKVYSLEDSSPNILEILPVLRRKSDRILVKLSPLFDVDECYRLFSPDASVEVVSLNGECKEVLVKIGFGPDEPRLRITALSSKGETAEYDFGAGDLNPPVTFVQLSNPAYLLVPDVGFYKARAVAAYARKYLSTDGKQDLMMGDYLYSDRLPEHFEGKKYRILSRHPYRPKELKRLLKSEGIRRLDIHRRNFPEPSERIAQALGVILGGTTEIFCTLFDGEPTVFFVARIN